MLQLEVVDQVHSYVLRCRGEIDIGSGPKLDTVLDLASANGHPSVVVDLTEVTFIDSTGLNSLVRARSRLVERGYELSVRGASPHARRLFAITGLDEVIPLD